MRSRATRAGGAEQLRRRLLEIDGRGYKAYQSIRGRYDFGAFELLVDHVQPDPYAAPSRLRVRVPAPVAGFPRDCLEPRPRQIALRDFLARAFAAAAADASRRRGSGKGGLIAVDAPGQEVLERTAVALRDGGVEVRFVVGLPAHGRRILGRQAAELLCEDLPEVVERCLRYRSLDGRRLRRHLDAVEDAWALRRQLRRRGLVAFVADGAILPRRTGVDPRPMERGAVAFRSPPTLRVRLERPNGGPIEGMGIPEGVTLIVGGGYHGKSTLLEALKMGVYDHVPGDGREFVVTDPSAAKIRAEDGRAVAGVDISPFIGDLPRGQSTVAFTTENASGSTSQAANIVEALEAGARVLLVDEDTSATNFMIRDHRMQQLVPKELEPITPFVDRVRQLYAELGVSTVLVMGGSGDYLDVADTVIAMESFVPRDLTERARTVAASLPTRRRPEGGPEIGGLRRRVPVRGSIDPRSGSKPVRVRARGREEIVFGRQRVDVTFVEQIAAPGQLRAIAEAMVYAGQRAVDGRRTLPEVIELVMKAVAARGLEVLSPHPRGDLAAFRGLELAAAINRLRTLKVRTEGVG